MKIIIGSRGSKLALTQTKWVANEIEQNNENVQTEIKIIKTKGDLIKDIPLDKIGDKGLFVKEIENALLNEEIDIAIHSMKDMPSANPDGLILAKPPKREDSRDALITSHHIKNIKELPLNSTIGTGSKRRKFQLEKIRPDLEIVSIRGNVDTRIQKMIDQKLDGIILACAGLNRLGITSCDEYSIIPIDSSDMIPAPAQGVLALQTRENDVEIIKVCESISDEKTYITYKVERDFMRTVDGGCHIPMGAVAKIVGEEIILDGIYGDELGNKLVEKQLTSPLENYDDLGEELGKKILEEFNK